MWHVYRKIIAFSWKKPWDNNIISHEKGFHNIIFYDPMRNYIITKCLNVPHPQHDISAFPQLHLQVLQLM